MPTKAQRAAANTKGQDPEIANIARGPVPGISEDQRRAEGTDASTVEDVGEHDNSPEARARQQPGGSVIETYAAGEGSVHDSRVGEGQTLVLGQAPTAPNTPQRGSRAHNEKFHPAVPNAINRSPILAGVDDDGNRIEHRSFEDVKADLTDDEGKPVVGEGSLDPAPVA